MAGSCEQVNEPSGCIGYGMDDRGSIPDGGAVMGFFLFATASRLALEITQPPVQWVSEALSPAVKRPGRGANCSSQFTFIS
jgi:hypothetical protein